MRIYFCDECKYPDEEKNEKLFVSYQNHIKCYGNPPDWEPFASIYNSCLECPKVTELINKIIDDIPKGNSCEDFIYKYGDSPV
jgi:hypothetical protein